MKKTLFALLLGAGLAAAQDCDTADCRVSDVPTPMAKSDADTLHNGLSSARADLRIQRTEFKRLARVEQTVLREARAKVYKDCPNGRSLARTYGAAADLMEAAASQAKGNEVLAKMCADMATSYRAVAKTIDRRESYLGDELRGKEPAVRAAATFRATLKVLDAAAKEAATWDAAKQAEVASCWTVVKKGDPQFRAFARNMKALNGAWKAVDGATAGDGIPAGLSQSLAKTRKLMGLLAPLFNGVKAERAAPEPSVAPT